jgi:putative spermidine/putrescine transport system permease protein
MLTARAGRWPILLYGPLLLFLLVVFAVPVVAMLVRGVTERELPAVLPETAAALKEWPGSGLPPDAIAATMAREMIASRRAGEVSLVANRINYDLVGSRSLILGTAKRLDDGAAAATVAELAALDPRWGDSATWSALRHAAGPLTSFYLWAALDRRVDEGGRVTQVAEEQRVFVDVFLRTFKIAALVTVFCVVLGYPVAYLLASLPGRWANPLLILVLLPFWTSALVRTTAWVVLLQTNGVVNNALRAIGIASAPLPLIYNRTGVYIAMTHVLLPFFILPLYAGMKRISPATVRAARSLGAGPFRAFRDIYLPQTMPGVVAGGAIVFTLALGYYITPALVGGGGDQMISSSIAFYINRSLNWGMASALSLLLLLPFAALLAAARAATRNLAP